MSPMQQTISAALTMGVVAFVVQWWISGEITAITWGIGVVATLAAGITRYVMTRDANSS